MAAAVPPPAAQPPQGLGGRMQAYKRHIVSEHLKDRYPYLEDIRGHLKDEEVSMARGDRLFPRLAEQLNTPSMAPEKLCEALRTIWDLSSHQENKCQAIASDVVAAATNLLMHDSVLVRRDAARVISAMSKVIGGRSLMPIGNTEMPRKQTTQAVPGPTLPRLAKLLLGCDDEEVKMFVAEALCSISVFRDGCQQVVDQGTVKGVAQYMTAMLPDIPATRPLSMCMLFLLRTLAAVTMYASNGLRDVLGFALLEKVIAFLGLIPKDGIPVVTPEESTETLRQALRLLWHCGNDPKGRKQMLKADGVRIITAYLTHNDAKVREAAVCALNVISLETLGKQEVLKHSKDGLAELLHSGEETPYLHETCVQLCRCASELPAFRFAFARRVLSSVWLLDKVYGTTALAAISPLLRAEEDDDTRSQAANVMAHFLRQEQPSQGDTIRVPPISPLDAINRPALFGLNECTDALNDLLELLPLAHDAALECLELFTDHQRPREVLQAIIDDRRVDMSKIDRDDMQHIKQMLGKTDQMHSEQERDTERRDGPSPASEGSP